MTRPAQAATWSGRCWPCHHPGEPAHLDELRRRRAASTSLWMSFPADDLPLLLGRTPARAAPRLYAPVALHYESFSTPVRPYCGYAPRSVADGLLNGGVTPGECVPTAFRILRISTDDIDQAPSKLGTYGRGGVHRTACAHRVRVRPAHRRTCRRWPRASGRRHDHLSAPAAFLERTKHRQ